ncbi:MAG: hypothetical protein ACM3SV_05820 [Betaproteobacteria bacterium]
MWFKRKPRPSPNPIYYCVSFLSPYFLLYIRCPRTPWWQLAREQEEPKKIVDGSAERRIHPVLVFSSREQAEEYASEVLGLRSKKVSFSRFSLSALWRETEEFEAITLPEESFSIQKTLRVAPVLYVKEPPQIGSVHPLPIAERK